MPESKWLIVHAEEDGLRNRGICADCTEDYLAGETFDHVFLMGPLYHLQDDVLQKEAVIRAMEHLKPGGLLYCSFPPEELALWMETGEKLVEIPEVVGPSEAVMYIGRKTGEAKTDSVWRRKSICCRYAGMRTASLTKPDGRVYNPCKPVRKSSSPGKFSREPLVLRSGKRNRVNGLLRAN